MSALVGETYIYKGGLLLQGRGRQFESVSAHELFGQVRGLSTITDTVGRVIDLTYNGSSQLDRVELPDGRGVSFGYSSGRLSTVTDPRGGNVTYAYDASGRLSKVTDQNGHVDIENVYGADGRVIQQKDAFGNSSYFVWDAAEQVATMTDARGKAWKDIYDGNVLVARVDPLGNQTTYGYDSELGQVTVTDPRGNTTTREFDVRGNTTSIQPPAPFTFSETYTYDTDNNPLSYTDPNGKTTTFEYDSVGNLTKLTDPLGNFASFGYNSNGLMTSNTEKRGKTTNLEYDALGNLVEVTSPLGNVTTATYDSSGHLTSRVDPRGNVTGANPADFQWNYSYNQINNLLSESDPLAHATSYEYDSAGNLIERTDAKGRAMSYGFNVADELASVTAADGGTTAYSYDVSGNLVTRTNANAHTTTYGYDNAGRLTTVSSPLGKIWAYQYDGAGNRTQVIDPNGNATAPAGDGTITTTYDQLNRLTGMNYSGSTPDVGFTYDNRGNRLTMTDGGGTETYSYDAMNQLKTVSRGTSLLDFGYDPAGNVSERDGFNLLYDDDGRMSAVQTGNHAAYYTYDPAGNLVKTDLPNDFIERRTYDRAGRLTEVRNGIPLKDASCEDLPEVIQEKCDPITLMKQEVVFTFSNYTLDEVGNPLEVQTQHGTATYSYDQAYRLTSTCQAPPCLAPTGPNDASYSYDDVGNWMNETRLLGTSTYAYDADDRLSSRTGPLGDLTSYSYDHNGNQTQAGQWNYAYNQQDRMTSAQAAGIGLFRYTFDGEGKRLSAALEPAGAAEVDRKKFVWDPTHAVPQLHEETKADGTPVRRYYHGLDLVGVTEHGASSPTTWKDHTFHYDGLGSVVGMTDDENRLEWDYDYEPFGQARVQARLHPLAPDNSMRFAGEYLDVGTSFYHLRARQYDPAIGRFTSQDPLTPDIDDPYVASYVYANNRPTVLVDPSGMRGQAPWYQRLGNTLVRGPDFVQLHMSIGLEGFLGPSGTVTIDRYGNIYLSGGPAITSPTLSFSEGVLTQETFPTESKLRGFFTQWSCSGGGGANVGGSVSATPGYGYAAAVGATTPGGSIACQYGWRVPWLKLI